MSKIIKIIGREIIDSRGNPTVEAEVHLSDGSIGIAAAPSGASKGSQEALELRDHDKSRFSGKGVLKAISFINNDIAKALINQDPTNQSKIDQIMIELDGTKNKSKFGANSIIAISLANAKAAALTKNIPLYEHIAELNGTAKKFSIPLPMINIINGGKHANNNINIQEFMIQPINAKNFKESVRIGAEIFHHLAKILHNKKMSTSVGDEGGYTPNLQSDFDALDIITEAIINSGYTLGKDITFAIDCAASEFYNKKTGLYELSKNEIFTSYEFSDYLKNITLKYPITSIEDGLNDKDWSGYYYQTKLLGNKIQLVGDDLFVTNENLLKKGIKNGIVNSILIKFNQIGTLTETMNVIKIAQNAGYKTIISHRSGETEDVTIADLAVGTNAGQIKTGSINRSDRTAKYNQLIRIEEKLGNKAIYNSLKK